MANLYNHALKLSLFTLFQAHLHDLTDSVLRILANSLDSDSDHPLNTRLVQDVALLGNGAMQQDELLKEVVNIVLYSTVASEKEQKPASSSEKNEDLNTTEGDEMKLADFLEKKEITEATEPILSNDVNTTNDDSNSIIQQESVHDDHTDTIEAFKLELNNFARECRMQLFVPLDTDTMLLASTVTGLITEANALLTKLHDSLSPLLNVDSHLTEALALARVTRWSGYASATGLALCSCVELLQTRVLVLLGLPAENYHELENYPDSTITLSALLHLVSDDMDVLTKQNSTWWQSQQVELLQGIGERIKSKLPLMPEITYSFADMDAFRAMVIKNCEDINALHLHIRNVPLPLSPAPIETEQVPQESHNSWVQDKNEESLPTIMNVTMEKKEVPRSTVPWESIQRQYEESGQSRRNLDMLPAITKDDFVLRTQKLLAPVTSRVDLSHKWLERPPFEYIRDIVYSIHLCTGLFEDVFDPEYLLQANKLPDVRDRIYFCQQLIDFVNEQTTHEQFDLDPMKMITGLDVKRTNKLLQEIALLAMFLYCESWMLRPYITKTGASRGGGARRVSIPSQKKEDDFSFRIMTAPGKRPDDFESPGQRNGIQRYQQREDPRQQQQRTYQKPVPIPVKTPIQARPSISFPFLIPTSYQRAPQTARRPGDRDNNHTQSPGKANATPVRKAQRNGSQTDRSHAKNPPSSRHAAKSRLSLMNKILTEERRRLKESNEASESPTHKPGWYHERQEQERVKTAIAEQHARFRAEQQAFRIEQEKEQLLKQMQQSKAEEPPAKKKPRPPPPKPKQIKPNNNKKIVTKKTPMEEPAAGKPKKKVTSARRSVFQRPKTTAELIKEIREKKMKAKNAKPAGIVPKKKKPRPPPPRPPRQAKKEENSLLDDINALQNAIAASAHVIDPTSAPKRKKPRPPPPRPARVDSKMSDMSAEDRERRRLLNRARKLAASVPNMSTLSELQRAAFVEEEKRRMTKKSGILRVFAVSGAEICSSTPRDMSRYQRAFLEVSLGFKSASLPSTTFQSRMFDLTDNPFIGEDFAFPVTNASVQRLKVRLMGLETSPDTSSKKSDGTKVLGSVELFVKDVRSMSGGRLQKKFRLTGHDATEGFLSNCGHVELDLVLSSSEARDPTIALPVSRRQ